MRWTSDKARFVGRAILPADSLSAGPAACKAACFFDPASLVFIATHGPRAGADRPARPLHRPRKQPESKYNVPLAALLLFAAVLPLRGEIVDRIAVSVGNRVVTASDIDREIRVTAFLDGKQPDFSPAAKRATAGRLVEQQLIRRELETSRYTIPSAAELQPAIEKIERALYPNQADYERALAAAGISSQDASDELLWRQRFLWFIDARFRLGVQVTEEEIQDYFEKVVKPFAEAAHPGQPATLDEYRDSIEETLAGPRVDQEVDNWLNEARKRTAIVYHDEAFQ